jgi:uncharacterized membrane protein YuzA (DUF378 family)
MTVKPLNIFTAILLIIGGLNWGLVAIAEFDLVATVFGLAFGDTNLASRIVYALVGLSALYSGDPAAGHTAPAERCLLGRPRLTRQPGDCRLWPVGPRASSATMHAPTLRTSSSVSFSPGVDSAPAGGGNPSPNYDPATTSAASAVATTSEGRIAHAGPESCHPHRYVGLCGSRCPPAEPPPPPRPPLRRCRERRIRLMTRLNPPRIGRCHAR